MNQQLIITGIELSSFIISLLRSTLVTTRQQHPLRVRCKMCLLSFLTSNDDCGNIIFNPSNDFYFIFGFLCETKP